MKSEADIKSNIALSRERMKEAVRFGLFAQAEHYKNDINILTWVLHDWNTNYSVLQSDEIANIVGLQR